MYTLGNITQNKCSKSLDNVLGIAVEAGEDLKEWTVVRLSSGTLVKMTAADQVPFGVTRTAGKTGEEVTVDTPFSHILQAKASATIAVGDKLQFTAYDGTLELNTATPVTVAGKPVHAIALSGGAANAEITVGVITSGDIW